MTMQALSNLVFRTIAPRDIRYVKPPDYKHLDGLAQDVYRIYAFRALHPSDAALIGVTSWASFQTTKRVSSWLQAPQALPDSSI